MAGRGVLAILVVAGSMGTIAVGAQTTRDLAFDRCGEPFGGLRPAGVTFLVGTPRGDTVADPKSTTGGHGQLVAVGRLGGAAAEDLERQLPDDRLAVLVPWGFDEGCASIPWSGPWRWAMPDSEEFFRAVLRPPSDWVDGRPTLDVPFAVWEGFPLSPWTHPLSAGRQLLSAGELFHVYSLLPTSDDLAARPYGAVSDLVEWRRDVGGGAARYPATLLLREAFRMAELARMRSTPLPFAGSYRVEVRDSTGARLATFHMRTGVAGTQPVGAPAAPGATVPFAPAPAEALATDLALAREAWALPLPGASGSPGDACRRPLGLKATVEETVPDDATRGWEAALAPGFLAVCFAGDPVLGSIRPGAPAAAGEAVDRGDTDTGVDESGDTGALPFVGAFRQERDGRYTFRQPAVLADGAPVTLAGERMDDVTLPPPPLLADPDD